MAARWRVVWPVVFLAVLPVLVHLPALSGLFRIDPLYLVSGVTPGVWVTNGAASGYPWVDGNAGVTTEALGRLAAHDWLGGKLPYWNPFSGIGLPLAAEGQNPAFFLPFVLVLALPHGLLGLQLVLMALAGLFSFALLRRMDLGLAASLVGASLFELNGTFAWVAHGPVMPVAFLPLMLLGLEQSRARFSVACALGVAWSFAAGFPETACLDLLFAGVWASVRFVQAEDRGAYAGRVGLAVGAGLLLAAPAVWPFLEALPREFVGTHAGVVGSGFRPGNVALLLFPGIFGAPMGAPLGLGRSDAVWVRAGGYCDLVLVVLALLALRWRAPERGLRLAIFGWIVLTGARAARLPAAVWVFGVVPFLRQANVHLYVLPSWSMGLAVLAAFAIRDWRAGALPVRRVAGLAAMLVVCVVAVAATDVADFWESLAGYRIFVVVAVGVPLVVAAVVLIAMRRGATWRARRVVLGAVIGNAALLFMLPELAGTHGRQVDVGAVRYLQDHVGLGRVLSLGPLVPNYGAYFRVPEIGHNYLPVPSNWVAYVRGHFMPESDGVNFFPGAPPDTRTLEVVLLEYERAGVNFVTTPAWSRPFDAMGLHAPLLAYHGTVMDVWQLAGPAAYFEAQGCTVTPVSRREAVTACGATSRLVRRELSFDGWRASVDGRAVAVDADGIFQAIALPAGVSRVRFQYAPPGIGFAWGAFVMGLGILAASKRWVDRAGPPRPAVVS